MGELVMEEREERAEWLKSLRPGQEVAHRTRHHGYVLFTVDRLTRTQFVLTDANGNEHRVNRETGYFVGAVNGSIEPITQKVKDSRDETRLRSWLSAISWHDSKDKPTLAQLRAMKKAFDHGKYLASMSGSDDSQQKP
jgi:hypothetical protein